MPSEPRPVPERNVLRDSLAGNVGRHPTTQPQHKAAPPVCREDSEEEDFFQPKCKAACRVVSDEDSEEDEPAEDAYQLRYAFGQGNYQGMAGYPNWTPPRYVMLSVKAIVVYLTGPHPGIRKRTKRTGLRT